MTLAKLLLPMALCAAALPTLAAEPAAKLATDAQKAAYSIGYSFGASLAKEVPDIDADNVQRGLQDALKKRQPALTPEQQGEAMNKFQQTVMAAKAARLEAAEKRNSEAAAKFMAANAKKPGVVALASGLQYQVITSGKGATPKANDRVKVHYEGTLLSGEVFDSSIKRGEPASFQVDQVIAGWTQALQKMKVGDKWKLFIPPELGYGKRGAGAKIEPGMALIFEVELLDVMPAK
ncbi:MAG: FKBP-type peptidyl-prolyl cis-trans isomerase [Rhizobacter sp.]|nr:FKBP-type peptidyl-prolyl cis-trans isomerase [Rhizobacter sp.]